MPCQITVELRCQLLYVHGLHAAKIMVLVKLLG